MRDMREDENGTGQQIGHVIHCKENLLLGLGAILRPEHHDGQRDVVASGLKRRLSLVMQASKTETCAKLLGCKLILSWPKQQFEEMTTNRCERMDKRLDRDERLQKAMGTIGNIIILVSPPQLCK